MALPATTIAPEVIHCIEADRTPTPDELQRVAQHIRSDLLRSAPAFAWGQASTEDAEQLLLLRAAEAATTGN
ncbi:hypothetical protein [Sphingomonas turrisvirgatae]|uniref:Uncharacterized protein n=1 Tax=Sphingomonas turrisvirgatae TaxID=1888892 RepID=A0A1E3LRV4_9SPHN|nr:hypothetical protein [Sphingomonas turrisvirgatae]ODP36444.1 hypothetical protein BFL28_05455 [Sphingomonas turrisvirgatae]